MRSIILEDIEAINACQSSDHVPNKETKKAIKDAQEKKNLTQYESVEDFFKKMGFFKL